MEFLFYFQIQFKNFCLIQIIFVLLMEFIGPHPYKHLNLIITVFEHFL